MQSFVLPTLYKQTASGGAQQWTVSVVLENTTPVIVVEYGKVGGKLKIDKHRILKGKNVNRSNQTTPYEQALKEATARWSRKKDREAYDEQLKTAVTKKALKPMLAHTYEAHGCKINWGKLVHIQPKLDGHRCLAFKECDNVTLVSRRGTVIQSLPHVVADLKSVMKNGDIYDGELYCHELTLNQIGSLIKKASEDSKKIEFHSYDVVGSTPFSVRFADLQMESRLADSVVVVPTKIVKSADAALEEFTLFVDSGYEGAMIRHGDEPYRHGVRSSSLLKMKSFKDDEFKIVGYREGKGKCEGMAVFYCETDAGNRFEVLAPGTHEQKKDAWQNRDSYVGKFMTVEFQYMTNTATPVPFPAVAKGLKQDV